ncbi:MAG: hypothetical protein ACYDER_16340 [Ktedonobacteraceae bacterium]
MSLLYPNLYETIPPPPPPPKDKRATYRAVIIVLIVVILVSSGGVISVIVRGGSFVYPSAIIPTPFHTAQGVIAAIMRQPGNDVQGKGVSYGSSVANWIGNGYYKLYEDVIPSSSSATWNVTYSSGPGQPVGIWIYSSPANAHQEYTTLQQENASYIARPQTWPMADIGWATWTYIGRCVAGDISATDALALPDVCT